MLADIDNAPTPSPLLVEDAPRPDFSEQAEISRATAGSFQADSDSEDDEDSPVKRPQGRALRRMLGLQDESPGRQESPRPPRLSPAPTNGLLDDEDLYSATPLKPVSRSPFGSAKSGGLFVSPARSGAGSDDELPLRSSTSRDRLAELVAKKRQERLKREALEDERRSLQKKRKRASSPIRDGSDDLPDAIVDDGVQEQNPDIERIMSDAARPTRKASKKALLELERETQRLARQQALAHQMKVKKKFTTNDLFAHFNFRQAQVVSPEKVTHPHSSSSLPHSDGAESLPREPVSTPPSSPPTAGPTPLQKQEALVEQGALSKLLPVREDSITSLQQMADGESDGELADLDDIFRAAKAARDAGPSVNEKIEPARKGLKPAWLGKEAVLHLDESSDDDLEIIAPLPPHLRFFDRIQPNKPKAADSKAIHMLKHLSHIGAYEPTRAKAGKGASRPSIAPRALEAQLYRKAKEQARAQQEERIADLKARGIVVQSVEEREREAEVFENLLEKARQDAVELRKAEKAALKRVNGEDGAAALSDDEDEDEDYVGSGSEEEDEGEEEAAHDEEGENLVDESAEESEGDDDAEESVAGEEEAEEGDATAGGASQDDEGAAKSAFDAETPAPANRKSRHSRVVVDDDESDADDEHEAAQPASMAPQPADDDPFAAFGFGGAGNGNATLLSPTQAFQATMQTPTQATQDDSLNILSRLAPSSIIPFSTSTFIARIDGTQQYESQASIVEESQSQVPESQRINLAWEMQPPETPTTETLRRDVSGLAETPGWEPTQDAGLPSPWAGQLRREETVDSVSEQHETQSTVRLRVSESPMVPSTAPAAARRGRLVRRQAAVLADSSDEEDEAAPERIAKQDAFREMARKRKEALTAAERAEADKEMKQMLEEQAEESEDEYAGLGGDDFIAPETDADREMIDSSHVEVDERQIAQLYAERERARQEEETNKLYKDLTTGALRRKQANAWGLEEDEDELAMRRRKMRQMEEARKRRLLLQDDNIAGLAQGKQSKGKDAFLKAIADDDDHDDLLDPIEGNEDSQAVTDSQTESQSQPMPLQEISGNKRPLGDETSAYERPPVKQRRTEAGAFRMPANMMEVRESLSFLLEESDQLAVEVPGEHDSEDEAVSIADDTVSDSEGNDDLVAAEEARQNDGGFAPNPINFDRQAMPPPRLPASQRRTPATSSKTAVVDRLSLKRDSSSTSSESSLGRTAWAAPASNGSFRVPSLLRRATTSSLSAASANERGVTNGPVGLTRENSEGGVKMGGSKKSSLAYQARAEERKAIVEASAKRREESMEKVAALRRGSSLLGRGLDGKFE